MSLLHIVKTPPDPATEFLMQTLAQDEPTTRFNLYEDFDYDKLVQLIFAHDRVITWW